MKKRTVKVLSIVLALVMMLSLFPVQAFAAPANRGGIGAETTLNPRLDGFDDSWGDLWGRAFDRLIGWFSGGRKPMVEPMPAVSLVSEDVEGMLVSVDAPEGALPQGATMEAVKVNNMDAVQDAVDQTEGVSGTVLAAVDITFRDKNGGVIQPAKDLTVTIKSAEIAGRNDLSVVHLDLNADELGENNVDAEPVTGAEFEANTVTFDAKNFSVYAVIGGGDNATKLLKVEFRNKDDSIINVQVVRINQIGKVENPIFDPGVPAINEQQSFEGWADRKAFTEEDTGYSVADINAYINENKDTLDGQAEAAADKTAVLTYYAKVYNVRYVVYHDQAGAVLMTQGYHIHEGSTPESVKINYPYVGFMGGQNFAGWITEDKVEVAGDYPLYKDDVGTIYQNDTTYQLSDTLQLYPYLNTGHWLVFDNYIDQDNDATTASFTSPVFYADGQNTVAPATPTRTGYTFDGWWKDEDFTDRFIFGSPIGEETTLYAKWKAKNTTYHVVIWTQKITDTPQTLDADKEYDFYESISRTAETGTAVSIETATTGTTADNRLGYNENGDNGKLGFYFLYNGTNTDTGSVTVKGDGSTVLNVYYDRKTITFSFYDTDKITPYTGGTGFVEAANGEYYYYTAKDSGYYLIGTGPNATYRPSSGNTIYYKYSYNSESYTVDQVDSYLESNGYTYFSTSTSVNSDTYSTSNTYTYSTQGTLYEYYKFSSNSYYSWIPYYYLYTESYTTGYYKVGEGPTPNAAGTHNLDGTSSISGLYGAQLKPGEWPSAGTGYTWKNDETVSGTTTTYGYPLGVTEFVPVLSSGSAETTEMIFYRKAESGTKIHIYYVGQELGSTEYTVPLMDGDSNAVDSDGTGNSWTPNETVQGYTVEAYRFGETGSWQTATVNTKIALYTEGYSSYIAKTGPLYIGFKRNTNKLTFISNNSDITPTGLPSGFDLNAVPYQTDLSVLANVKPSTAPEGYYFDGWYADSALSEPYVFSNATMPDNNVRIYAKWTQMRFRVVCDPTGGEQGVNPSDITFNGNQATTFRVDYGEVVQGSSLSNAQREGYTLLGWYLDKAHTIPFNFANPITDTIQNMDMDYATSDERSGRDPWNGNRPYNDADGEHDDVVGKLTIYASWRQDPDGVIGINVRYLATDKNGNTGKFSDNKNIWDDPNIYADQAKAFGQPASTPENGTLQFLYWEILDENKNVVGKAYPGQLWTVDYSNAVEEAINANSTEALFTFADYLRGENALTNSRVNPTPVKAETMTVYAPVDTIETGVDYLIGVTASNGTTYLLMSYNPSTGTYYGSASLSGYTTDHLSYAIPAVLDENGNVTGVDSSNISGATLAHVEWLFNSTSNGKYSIQSGYNSNNYLRVGDDDSTTNLNLYPASYSSGYGATWVWDSSTHYLSHYYNSSYYRLYLSMLSVGGVPTYFDVDYDTDYARTVQLFKKTTIEVGPTMHTVTFMDGYTNTKIADVQVEDGAAATAPDAPDHSAQGMIFNGWDTAFDNVTENITVTAQYVSQSTLSYTVTFRYMNSEGEWVTSTQTVQHGQRATAPDLPTPPAGYTFNSWDKKFDQVTSNLTINAVYKQVATTKYVVTLRAVYGRANTTAKTHITWYANNGTGAFQSNENLEINEAVNIPTPTSFTYLEETRGTVEKTGLVYEDHVFLGWARMISNNSSADRPDLTEEDLYLRWDPDAQKYYCTGDEENEIPADQEVSAVAADEMLPYHDMFAVWAKVFYVYHSGTGVVEKIVINNSTVTTDTEGTKTYTPLTYDLAHTTSDGFLYGGYYTEYAGASENFRNKDSFKANLANLTWNTVTDAANLPEPEGQMQDLREDLVEKNWISTTTDATGKHYNGYNAKWTKATAIAKTDDGHTALDIIPVAGEIYYIKEVDANKYLQPYMYYTFDKYTGVISTAWLISDTDDLNYQETGFVLTDQNTKAKDVVKSLTVTNTNGGKQVKLTSLNVFKAMGYLSYLTIYNDGLNGQDPVDLGVTNKTVGQYWVTPDGLIVTGTAERVYTDISNKDNINTNTMTQTTVASTIKVFNAQAQTSGN